MNTQTASRRTRRQNAAINITPLVDVLLILLVVLMLAMPLFVKRLPVDLPQTSLGGTPTPMVSLSLVVQEDGKLFVDGSSVPLETIASRVNSRTTVELAIDKAARYEIIAKVVAALQAAGPKEIVLLTR